MRWAFHITLAALMVLALSAAISSPTAFQKTNLIRLQSEPMPVPDQADFPVSEFLAGIPYVGDFEATYVVNPREKRDIAIGSGIGNCSNLTFGAAYEFVEKNIDFQIIHLLPVDGFLTGRGHTVLRLGFRHNRRLQVGIVDMLAGALPASHGKAIDVAQLASGPVPEFGFIRLNEANSREADYYGSFLDEIDVGIIRGSDVERYFDFIESIYVPLGRPELEKHMYDGIALLVGVLPEIQVTSLDRLYEGREGYRLMMIGSLWVLRAFVLIAPLLLLGEFVNLARRTWHGART